MKQRIIGGCLLLSLLLSGACGSNINTAEQGRHSALSRSQKAQIHAELARGYLQQQQYDVTRQELVKALQFDSNHSESNYVMALLSLQLRQNDEAQQYFKKAVTADRDNAAAAHDFAVFLCQTGNEVESLKYFDRAAENPLFSRAELSYMRAGECLANIEDQRAAAYLQKALTLDEKLPPALFKMAEIKYNEGAFLSARVYIDRLFAITKKQSASLFLAYQIESALATNAAETYRQALLDKFPESMQASKLRSKLRNE